MKAIPDTQTPTERRWRIRDRSLPLGRRTLVMGILNVTPDSFSDGGRFLDPDTAVEHALSLVEEGADLLDVGGESTRPGSQPVPAAQELARVLPVVKALAERSEVPISVDTRKAEVARAVVAAGAHIVNDVTGLSDPAMAEVVQKSGAGAVIMHMKGDPATMQIRPNYHDVVGEVREFLHERAEAALRSGIPRESIVLDPGLGFGKRTGGGIDDNLALLRNLGRLTDLGYPILVGASRKKFLGNVVDLPVENRLEASLAAAAVAAWNGADIVRVHDVQATRRVVDVVDAIRTANV